MTIHYWEKINHFGFPAYKCGWCGLGKCVPQIVRKMRSIKDDDDNFDITCALTQDVDKGSIEHQELWNCPIDNEKKKKINSKIKEAEDIIAEAIAV